ncbi:MAG TPA: flippase [Methanocorpusculum sp.]|nr:flippase [Methanocorpusculum sp.]
MNIPVISALMRLSPIKRQSITSLGFTILVTLAGFISTMLFSHLLGKDLMGVYYLFVTYFSVFNLIGDGGFGGAAVKKISEGKDQNAYFTAYMTLRTILIIVSTVILLAIEPLFVDLSEYHLVPCIIIALVVAYFSNALSAGVHAKNHVGIFNAASGISELIRIGVSILLVLIGYSVYGMIGGFVVGSALAGILCIKYFRYRPAKFTRHHIRQLLSFSLWTLLISSAGLIMGYADTIFIGYFMDNGDVGVYRVALQFTGASVFIVNAVNSTLAPKISNWSTNSKMDEIPPVVARSFTYGLILAIPVAVGGFILADELLYYFYGADFAAGAVSASILFLFQIVNVFLIIMGTALSSSGHPRNTFYGTLAAVILNVILDVLLIPVMGINGAAVGSLCAIIINVLIITHELKKFMPVFAEKKPIVHILLASLIMGAAVLAYALLVPMSNVGLVLIPVAFGAVLYSFVLLKLDKGIHDDIKGIITNFGLPWPKRL